MNPPSPVSLPSQPMPQLSMPVASHLNPLQMRGLRHEKRSVISGRHSNTMTVQAAALTPGTLYGGDYCFSSTPCPPTGSRMTHYNRKFRVNSGNPYAILFFYNLCLTALPWR